MQIIIRLDLDNHTQTLTAKRMIIFLCNPIIQQINKSETSDPKLNFISKKVHSHLSKKTQS